MTPSVGGNPNRQSAKSPNGHPGPGWRPESPDSPSSRRRYRPGYSRSTAAISFIMGSSSANRCTIASFTPDAT